MPRLPGVFAVTSLLAICGCGGGGGSNSSTLQNATFQIDWPTRSRAALTNPLTSALSVRVVFRGAATNGADVTMSIDRDASKVSAYTGTYTLTQAIRPSSSRTMNATFYAQAGETGPVVGTATSATATQGAELSFGTISLTSVVSVVSVVPASLTVGSDPVQLQFECKDGNGATVAVSPGSATWAISSNPAYLSLTPDGQATPITNGTANVTATVDGIVSNVQGIQVVNPAPAPDFENPGFESPAISAGSYAEASDAATGWTGASVITGTQTGFGIANASHSWGSDAKAGSQYGFLQSSQTVETDQGSCTQTVTGLTVGKTYKVEFWMARRNGDVGGNTGEPISLTANGTSIFASAAPNPDGSWNQYASSTFTAGQTSYTFVFSTEAPSPGQDQTTRLDEVHLVQTN